MGLDRTLTGAGWIVQPIRRALDFFSDAMPNTEATTGSPGDDDLAARGKHVHPRLASAHRVTLDANGQATITYTRTFDKAPAVVPVPTNITSGGAVIIDVVDIKTGALWTGCMLKGRRTQALPTLSILLTELSKLSGFDPIGGSAAGVEVSVTAIQQST